VILDFETDRAGRPAGTLRADSAEVERFEGWLDLLRALEGRIEHTHDVKGVRPGADTTIHRRTPAGTKEGA
jgi:hypothetical protein